MLGDALMACVKGKESLKNLNVGKRVDEDKDQWAVQDTLDGNSYV